jgi:hypothetical protein
MRVKMQSAQGVLLDYDPTLGKEAEGMGKMLVPMFEAMHKKPFQIRMTSQGEIKEVKLPQGIPESMNQLMGGQGGGFFNEDWVKQFGTFAFFPEKPTAVGGTWTTKRKAKIPALGTPVMETTFRYEGTEKRNGKALDKLSAVIRFQTEAGNKETSPKIQDQEGYRGTILFDPEVGRVVESRGKAKMKMEITIMGQKIAIEMTTKEEMKLQEGKASSGSSSEEK